MYVAPNEHDASIDALVVGLGTDATIGIEALLHWAQIINVSCFVPYFF
jgi:hypothetical protein